MTEISYIMDVHVPRVITNELRGRDVSVTTAQEGGFSELDDDEFLEKAKEKEHVIFTLDTDFLKEAKKAHEKAKSHQGLIYTHLLSINIGDCIEDLQLIAEEMSLEDMENVILFLPL